MRGEKLPSESRSPRVPAILLAMLGRPRTDAPKTNRDPAEVERKLNLLDEPHIAPLTEFVARPPDRQA